MMNSKTFCFIFLFSVLITLSSFSFIEALATTHEVIIPFGAHDIKNPNHFVPSETVIMVNDEIIWTNSDTTTHTITSGSFQNGADGIFNSGIIESKEQFSYMFSEKEIGKLLYYCTIHPWMNGIIVILDEAGQQGGRVAEAGSENLAMKVIQEAESLQENAKSFVQSEDFEQASISYSESGRLYSEAAHEYYLLKDFKKAATYYHESGVSYNKAASIYESMSDFKSSVLLYYEAGINFHFAGTQYQLLDDYQNAGKEFSKAMLNKRMVKYGSDYVLPPKHQLRWLADPLDLVCKKNYQIIIKSSTFEPYCVSSSSLQNLLERGWGKTPNELF